jgi:phosphotransferase system IIB component
MFLMSLTILLFVIIVPVVLVLSLVVFLILKNKKGNKKIKIDAEFINNLVDILGGKENVLSVTNENGRIKFELEDLELAKLEDLKALSNSGVFVTNNTVKTLFPHDAKTISNAIKNL